MNKSRYRVAWAFVLIASVIFWHSIALADDVFRCGGSIIREGQAGDSVLKKCGQPVSRDKRSEPILARNAGGGTREVGMTNIEIWVYDRGQGKFPARLTVEDGIIQKIELLKD